MYLMQFIAGNQPYLGLYAMDKKGIVLYYGTIFYCMRGISYNLG
jgi:hypothetical protein